MQGIRVAELKSLLEYLHTLKQEMGLVSSSQEELRAIVEKEKSLQKIYSNYKDSLQQVSECVQLFENEKLAVRKFLKQQKQSLKAERRLLSE
jgi:hypothetical protein